MSVPPPYDVPTTSAVAGGDDATAVMGRRTVAWVLDVVIFMVVLVGLYAALAEYVTVPSELSDTACDLLTEADEDRVNACLTINDRAYFLSSDDVGIQTLASFGYFGFFVVMQGVVGASPGKLLTGIRVVDAGGKTAGIAKSLGRTLLWAVDGAPWFIPLVGPIVGLTTTGHRRVGDMAAGTFVVGRAHVGQPVAADAAAPPPGQPAWGAPYEAPPWSPPPPPSPQRPVPPSPTPPPAAPPSLPDTGPAVQPPPPTAPMTPDDGTANDAARPPEPEPMATEAADAAPPEVTADPAWSWTPDLEVSPPPGAESATDDHPDGDDLGRVDLSLPEIDTSHADAWIPPASAFDDSDAEATPTREQVAPPEGARPTASETSPEPPPAEAVEPVVHELPPPQWDSVRDTYLQWDPNAGRWLQWDAAANRWEPLDT